MIAWFRSIDWPDPFEAFAVFMTGFVLLSVVGFIVLFVGTLIEATHRDGSMPHELSTNDGSTPPAIVTDRTNGCQYLRGDWDQMTPRMGADGKQVCTGAAR